MNDIVDVRDSEDLFINKYAIDVTVETSVDEKEKKEEEHDEDEAKKRVPTWIALSSFLFLLFFLFAAYRWSICATSTVYLKKHSLIDSCLAMLSLFIRTEHASLGSNIYIYR